MIRQRVLYVGIGGSGLDLGIKLDEAMRREICGLDGRALMKKGGPFAGYRPNQLPSYVQSLYIDFAAESLEGVTRNIAGGNSLAAKNLIPTIDNYPALATDLRLGASDSVSWIPPATGEPTTRPLNGGAGQFPTVGRAAFFSSIKNSGYRAAIGKDFALAIGSLDNAMGELDSYSNQNSSSEIAVYVGFSMSGGTGCGIFLDVIQLLMHEMHSRLGSVGVTVLPIVMLPSTFDGLLPPENEYRAKLNCARALLDLTELIEQLQAPNPARQNEFKIQYPDKSLGSNGEVSIEFIGKAPQIPVATLVSKPSIMDRNDVARSVAASIVAQASTVRPSTVPGQVENKNSFIEELINYIPQLQKPHSLGLGTHPLMPMVSSSLTLPSRKIADIIAKQIVSEGLDAIIKQNQQRGVDSEGGTNSMMGHFGLGNLVRPETFDQDHAVVFLSKQQPKNQKELDAQLHNLRSKVQNALPIIEKRIEQEVREKSVFRVLDGLKGFLTAEGVNEKIDLPSAIQIALRTLNELETNGRSVADSQNVNANAVRPSKKKMRLVPKKLSATTVASAFKKEREQFEQDVRRRWWLRWANSSNAWLNSVEAGRTSLNEISKLLRDFADDSRNSASADRSDLIQDRVGVVNFVPTGGRPIDDAMDQMVEDTSARIRRDIAIQDQSAAGLLQALVVDESGMNGWSEFVDRFANRQTNSQIFAAVLDPVRSAVESALTGTDAVPGTLRNLGQLLVDVASSTSSSEASMLRARLGSLVPNDLVPPGNFLKGSVLISYPGTKNSAVEEMITHSLELAGAYKNMVNKNGTIVEFTPTGDSDVLTVNINLVGQGLLDNPETREILQRWRDGVSSDVNHQLKWRQRKGYENIEQIGNSLSQDRVLVGLLKALLGGILEIVDGSPESPEKMLLKNPDGQVAEMARVEIEIPQLPDFSSWPNILRAFEQMVLDINTAVDFREKVVAGMFSFVPPILKESSIQIPLGAKALLGLSGTEIPKLKAALENRSDYSEVFIREMESALAFWELTLPRAMGSDTAGGRWSSIRAAVDAAEAKMRQ
jgi:hypothetical protein